MALFQKIFGRKSESTEDNGLPEVEPDQPRNNYSEINIMRGHLDIIRFLVRIDAHRIASASDDHTIIIWHTIDARQMYKLEGHTLPITSLIVVNNPILKSPMLISGSSDKSIKLWDLMGKCLQTLKDPSGSVKCLGDLGNSLFLSAGTDLSVWNIEGKILCSTKRPQDSARINILVPLRNGKVVTCCGLPTLDVYYLMGDPESPTDILLHKTLDSHREVVNCIIVISDGMFASGSLDGAIVLWSSHSLLQTKLLNFNDVYQDPHTHLYVFSVQHMTVKDNFLIAAIGNGFVVYDITNGGIVLKIARAHAAPVLSVIHLENGGILATASSDATIRLWDVSLYGDEEDDFGLSHLSSPTSSSRLATNSSISSTTSSNSSPLLSRRPKPAKKRGECIGELLAHTGSIIALLDCSGAIFVSASADHLVILWKNTLIEKARRNDVALKMYQSEEIDITKE